MHPERKCPATLRPGSRCRGELRPNSHCLCVLRWEQYVRCQGASRASPAPGASGRSLCVQTHIFFPDEPQNWYTQYWSNCAHHHKSAEFNENELWELCDYNFEDDKTIYTGDPLDLY